MADRKMADRKIGTESRIPLFFCLPFFCPPFFYLLRKRLTMPAAKSKRRFTYWRAVVNSRRSNPSTFKAERRSVHDQACIEKFRSVNLYIRRRPCASARAGIQAGGNLRPDDSLPRSRFRFEPDRDPAARTGRRRDELGDDDPRDQRQIPCLRSRPGRLRQIRQADCELPRGDAGRIPGRLLQETWRPESLARGQFAGRMDGRRLYHRAS